jgi:hypothetical protein
MPQQKAAERLPEPRRKEIFHVLVVAQDLQMTVEESRQMVCEHFRMNECQVREIEREGLDCCWPPL